MGGEVCAGCQEPLQGSRERGEEQGPRSNVGSDGRDEGASTTFKKFWGDREGLCGNWVSEARVACFSQVDWGGEKKGG